MNLHQNLPEASAVAAILVKPEIVSVLPATACHLADNPGSHSFWSTLAIGDSLTPKKVATEISEHWKSSWSIFFFGNEWVFYCPNKKQSILKQFLSVYQGIRCMKALARSYVCGPNMDKWLEDLVHKIGFVQFPTGHDFILIWQHQSIENVLFFCWCRQ